MKQKDIHFFNENERKYHIFTVVPYVDRNNENGDSLIIRTNNLTKTLHLKYNGIIYSHQVPENKNS